MLFTFLRNPTKHEWLCGAVALLICVFYILTIRSGQPWGDDFAMYVHETKNLSEGTPLGKTGYIYNPQRPWVGPKLYPPVFPVLLIPGYLMGGLRDLEPMKLEVVLCFAGLLVVLWRNLGCELPFSHRAAMLAIVGLNPLVWSFKDLLVSDLPFTLFVYLTLALSERIVEVADSSRHRTLQILLLATSVYLCFGSRTIGIVLVPALLLQAILRWRRGGKSIAWAAGIGLALCLLQQLYLGSETSYADQLKLSAGKFVQNIAVYGWSLASYWDNPFSRMFRDLLFVALAASALAAYVRHLWTGARIYEIFLPFYLGVVLLYPDPGGPRYLIPVLPLFVCYSLEGFQLLQELPRIHLRKHFRVVRVAAIMLVFLTYGTEFTRLDFGSFKQGIAKEESQELFSYVRENTNPEDVFVFRKPRALALFTGRSAAVYPLSRDAARTCAYFRTIGASYLIEAPELDDGGFDEFVKTLGCLKQEVYQNKDFEIFRLDSPTRNGSSSVAVQSMRGRAISSRILREQTPDPCPGR